MGARKQSTLDRQRAMMNLDRSMIMTMKEEAAHTTCYHIWDVCLGILLVFLLIIGILMLANAGLCLSTVQCQKHSPEKDMAPAEPVTPLKSAVRAPEDVPTVMDRLARE